MRSDLKNAVKTHIVYGIFSLFILGLFPVNLFGQTIPSLPNPNWFSSDHAATIANYKQTAETIQNNFSNMKKGSILDIPGQDPKDRRMWPQPGDPNFGHLAPRAQVKMSYMFQNAELDADDNPTKIGVHEVSGNSVAVMWLTVHGKLREYLNDRNDQWDASITDPNSNDPKSVWNRGAAALGMLNLDEQPGFGRFQNVADLWIDEDALFRTGLYQNLDSSESETPNKPQTILLGNWAGNEEYEPWLNEWPNIDTAAMALRREIPLIDLGIELDESASKYANWYNGWWVANTKTGNFPWTGHGYTYDWAYLDEFNDAVGLTEFVVMPSGGGENKDHVFHYEVVYHNNTLDYMLVPEPNSLMLVIAGLVFVSLRVRRR